MFNPKNVVREAFVILAGVIGAYLYLSLISFSPADLAADNDDGLISNWGGNLGALVAYGLLFTFGKSAYIVIAVIIYALWLHTRLIKEERFNWVSTTSSVLGMCLLLFATSGIEALRIYGDTTLLPGERSGGILGFGFAKTLYELLGFHGASLILIGLWFISLSLFALFSWASVCDWIGDWLGRSSVRLAPLVVKILAWFTVANSPQAVHRSGAQVGLQPAKQNSNKRGPTMRKKIHADKGRTNKSQEPAFKPVASKDSTSVPTKMEQIPPVSTSHDPPPIDLLASATAKIGNMTDKELHQLAETIEERLAEFGVKAKVVEILPGPVVTRYEIQPATGVKGAQVINLVRDLSRALSVTSIRVLETIAGKTTMGLEVPNAKREIVTLQEVINSPQYMSSKSPLSLALGKDISGEVYVADLADMPHLLVAGTTGSGKSVQINSMILSILYKSSPDEVRLILIDPKVVELAPFDDLPHLLAPVVTDMNLVPTVLSWCVNEMESRYQLMAQLGVRNLASLNAVIAKGARLPDSEEDLTPLPLLIVMIDELADLMAVAGKKVEQLVSRLAQKARAAGIHLILATQRPSVDVITGLIKANIPSRIAFQVSSRIDSRTILDQGGAETLLGKGDMLFLPSGSPELIRIHGAFVSDADVRKVTNHIRTTSSKTEKIDFSTSLGQNNGGLASTAGNGPGSEQDPLYDQAVEIVMTNNRISISLVQRHLRVGYNRAARLIEDMERTGLISTMDSSGNRKILVKPPSKD